MIENAKPNLSFGRARDEEEPKEGEILGGDEDLKQSIVVVVHQPHPLENSPNNILKIDCEDPNSMMYLPAMDEVLVSNIQKKI